MTAYVAAPVSHAKGAATAMRVTKDSAGWRSLTFMSRGLPGILRGSIEEDGRHHVDRQRGRRTGAHAFGPVEEVSPARVGGRLTGGRAGEPAVRAAQARWHGSANGGIGAEAADGVELRRAEVAVEQVRDVERDVEPASAVAEMQVDLRETRSHDRPVVRRGAIADRKSV